MIVNKVNLKEDKMSITNNKQHWVIRQLWLQIVTNRNHIKHIR